MTTDLGTLRELFNARFDALDARINTILSNLERDNDRRDESIERLAERTTHTSETRRLTERVLKVESRIENDRDQLSDLNYKVKVTWGVGGTALGLLLSIIGAIIKGWIGV
jgi:DNA-binding transcriptional regulator GbsR (MarR family)